MRITDVMTRTVECVGPATTLDFVAQKMAQLDVGAIPVEEHDEAIGIITDRDIAIRAVAHGFDPSTTTVEQIMTQEPAYCHEDDSLQDAARIMEQRQIRRLLVCNADHKLVGIVSLGDMALRADGDVAEEVLEQVSMPNEQHTMAGQSDQSRQLRSHSGHTCRHGAQARHIGHHHMLNTCLSMAAGIAIGAAGMYMLDPSRGRRRRALVRDKLVHASHVAQRSLGRTGRHACGKVKGLAHETTAMFRRDHVDDSKLHDRVRAALGRAVCNAHSVKVDVSGGTVILSGTASESEIPGLLKSVSKVRASARFEICSALKAAMTKLPNQAAGPAADP